MLYDEFIQGTGCRETDYNYSVYKDIEEIYMNSNMTKEEAYAIGKMRVNNGLTEEEEAKIEQINKDIAYYEGEIKYYIEYAYIGTWEEVKTTHTKHMERVKGYKDLIKEYKLQINEIQSRAK